MRERLKDEIRRMNKPSDEAAHHHSVLILETATQVIAWAITTM
jgi:hypothetical protein